MSRRRASSPIGTGPASPERASSARARTAYGDFVVMESTRAQSLRLLVPAAIMAAVWVLSDQTDPNPAPAGLTAVSSSLAHVVVFGALAAAWRWALGGRALVAVLLAVAYGVVDELHQSTTPGRDATPVDVALDALGAVLATAAPGWARRRGRPAG